MPIQTIVHKTPFQASRSSGCSYLHNRSALYYAKSSVKLTFQLKSILARHSLNRIFLKSTIAFIRVALGFLLSETINGFYVGFLGGIIFFWYLIEKKIDSLVSFEYELSLSYSLFSISFLCLNKIS